MNHPSPEPLFGDARSGAPERKAAPASVLAAPRLPVTRWNRKVLLAGAAVLASIVGLGFYLGFGGANSHPKKHDDLQAAAETDNPQQPEIANRYAQGYADPAVKAAASPPGLAALEAGAQARAARSGSPFFGGAQGASEAAAPPTPVAFVAQEPGGRARDVAEIQAPNGQGGTRQFAAGSRADDYLTNPLRDAISPWEVKAGTIIPAALITAINSDLPGEVI